MPGTIEFTECYIGYMGVMLRALVRHVIHIIISLSLIYVIGTLI